MAAGRSKAGGATEAAKAHFAGWVRKRKRERKGDARRLSANRLAIVAVAAAVLVFLVSPALPAPAAVAKKAPVKTAAAHAAIPTSEQAIAARWMHSMTAREKIA